MWSFISLVINWSWVTFAFIANGHQRNNRFDGFFGCIFRAKSYLWQCILSVGTRNHDKKLHIPKTCSRSIIYNNSLMQWLMSIMRFCICLNVLVHRQYSSCESANFSFDRTMCSSSSCPHAACTQPLFISLSLAFVYLNRVLFRYSWYTKLSLYGDDCIHVKSVNHGLCTFSIYWFSTYVHVALQFLFDTFVSELACCQMLAFILFLSDNFCLDSVYKHH